MGEVIIGAAAAFWAGWVAASVWGVYRRERHARKNRLPLSKTMRGGVRSDRRETVGGNAGAARR